MKPIVTEGILLGLVATIVVTLFKVMPLSEDTISVVIASTLTLSFFYGWQQNLRGRYLFGFSMAWIVTELVALSALSFFL